MDEYCGICFVRLGSKEKHITVDQEAYHLHCWSHVDSRPPRRPVHALYRMQHQGDLTRLNVIGDHQ